MNHQKNPQEIRKALISFLCFFSFISFSTSAKAGIEDYYMANTFHLEEVSLEFNTFYNDLIRQKLKSLNQKKFFKRKSCQAVVKKIRPVFGGLFKSKKVPLGVFKEFPNIDHFPKHKDPHFQSSIDKKGLYLQVASYHA